MCASRRCVLAAPLATHRAIPSRNVVPSHSLTDSVHSLSRPLPVGAWAFLETNGKGECFSKRGGLSEAKMTSKVD